MSALSYSPAENINRILMDKNTKYVVVEGDSDIPKYESTIRALTNNIVDFEPVSLGCKDNIKSLLRDVKNNNFIAITDGDFDGHTMPKDARLIVLSRYSIENFIFCNNVITPLIANLVKTSEASTRTWFDIKEWIEHLHKKLPLLLRALFYYQNNVHTDRKSWTKADLFVNNCWKVCSIKVNALLNYLFDNNIPKAKIQAVESFKKLKKEALEKLCVRNANRMDEIVNNYKLG